MKSIISVCVCVCILSPLQYHNITLNPTDEVTKWNNWKWNDDTPNTEYTSLYKLETMEINTI